jgi:hypothetical protein
MPPRRRELFDALKERQAETKTAVMAAVVSLVSTEPPRLLDADAAEAEAAAAAAVACGVDNDADSSAGDAAAAALTAAAAADADDDAFVEGSDAATATTDDDLTVAADADTDDSSNGVGGGGGDTRRRDALAYAALTKSFLSNTKRVHLDGDAACDDIVAELRNDETATLEYTHMLMRDLRERLHQVRVFFFSFSFSVLVFFSLFCS